MNLAKMEATRIAAAIHSSCGVFTIVSCVLSPEYVKNTGSRKTSVKGSSKARIRCANTPRGMAVPIRKAPNTACRPMTSETYADKVHNISDTASTVGLSG